MIAAAIAVELLLRLPLRGCAMPRWAAVITWIFGYGSLVWRPDFPYTRRVVAYVDGWQRRLEQGSPDHRGTPDNPGRVVTLIRAPGLRCGGVAYAIEPSEQPRVLAALDVREQGGYDRVLLEATLGGGTGGSVQAITWVARAGNPNHLGPAPLDAMIAQIRGARGPSGSNEEYIRRLAETLRTLQIDDPHVFEVAAALETR